MNRPLWPQPRLERQLLYVWLFMRFKEVSHSRMFLAGIHCYGSQWDAR